MLASLHNHSEFSQRDSLIRVADLPRLAKEKGWEACALTDHGAIEGLYYFREACKKEKLKSISGIEFYIKVNDSDKAHHLTVLAKNAKGFSSIASLVSQAHKNHYNDKRHRAEVPIEMILEQLSDCIVLSGCFSSPFWRMDNGAPSANASIDIAKFVDKFQDDLFFEYQGLYDWNEQIQLNKTILEVANVFGRPVVVTPDCHFEKANDSRFHEALLAVASGYPVGSERAWKFSTHLNFIPTPDELLNALIKAGVPEDIARNSLLETGKIAEKISNWEWSELPAPELPDVEGDLRVLAENGLKNKNLYNSQYIERLNRELDCFQKAGLDKYFLLVMKCVNLFKSHGAEIGPRGSVGGSLVAYALGLAVLDPLAHGLMFERFFYPGRIGVPDIDIDVDTSFRPLVPEILRKEFGDDKVAQISNFATFGHRQAIRDAARAYGIEINASDPPHPGEKIGDISELEGGKELIHKNPEAADFARKLVGKIRQFGAHAGGFVISKNDLTSGRSAIVTRGKDKALVWDMNIAEKLGFIKFDFLGIDSLDAIKEIKKIGIDLDNVSLDDKEVYNDFRSGRTAGVPQFLSPGLRMFTETLGPTKFEDLVWLNSAFRPGALGQFDPQTLSYKYKEDPNSVLVYQEDVMKLCVDLAGFSWTEADGVRKVVAKSLGADEFMKWQDKFVKGCVEQGTRSEEDAKYTWKRLAEFGRDSFNKSHSYSYTWHAYRVAFAKRNHSLKTFATLLNAHKDKDNLVQDLLDEAEDFGVEILAPDINNSEMEWKIEDGKIRSPLSRLAYVKDLRVVKLILEKRGNMPFKDVDDFKKRVGKRKYDIKMVEKAFSKNGNGEFVNKLAEPNIPVEFLQTLHECTSCALRRGCKQVVLPAIGRTNICVVGQSPGKEENLHGVPFIGASGELLDDLFQKYGIDREDLTITNVAKCKPPWVDKNTGKTKDGKMTKYVIDKYIKECPWIVKELEILKPPLVLTLGKEAYQALGGDPLVGITKANGTVFENQGIVVCASVHPSFCLRDRNQLPELERSIRKFAKLYHKLIDSRKLGNPIVNIANQEVS